MTITTISSREFNQDTKRCQKSRPANYGPFLVYRSRQVCHVPLCHICMFLTGPMKLDALIAATALVHGIPMGRITAPRAKTVHTSQVN